MFNLSLLTITFIFQWLVHASCLMPLYRDGHTSENDKVRLLASIYMATMGFVRHRTGPRSHLVATFIRELVNPDAQSPSKPRLFNAEDGLDVGDNSKPLFGFGFPFIRMDGQHVDKCRVCIIDFGKWTLSNLFHFMCKFLLFYTMLHILFLNR